MSVGYISPDLPVLHIWKWKLNTSDSNTKNGLYVPIVYGKESFKLSQKLADEIKLANTMYNVVPRFVPLVGFSVAVICLIGLVILSIQRFKMLKPYYWKNAVLKPVSRRYLI